MSKEPQTSVSDQVGERTASGGCSDFHIRHMASIWYPQDLADMWALRKSTQPVWNNIVYDLDEVAIWCSGNETRWS